jgi:Phage integrase family
MIRNRRRGSAPDQSAHWAQGRYRGVPGQLRRAWAERPPLCRKQGGIPRRRNFNRIWKTALRRAGVPTDVGLHLHDLRYTGSTWSAQRGATRKELMARIGHSSTRAAMIYQHATRDGDQAIAAALDALIEEARSAGEEGERMIWHRSGTRQTSRPDGAGRIACHETAGAEGTRTPDPHTARFITVMSRSAGSCHCAG